MAALKKAEFRPQLRAERIVCRGLGWELRLVTEATVPLVDENNVTVVAGNAVLAVQGVLAHRIRFLNHLHVEKANDSIKITR